MGIETNPLELMEKRNVNQEEKYAINATNNNLEAHLQTQCNFIKPHINNSIITPIKAQLNATCHTKLQMPQTNCEQMALSIQSSKAT